MSEVPAGDLRTLPYWQLIWLWYFVLAFLFLCNYCFNLSQLLIFSLKWWKPLVSLKMLLLPCSSKMSLKSVLQSCALLPRRQAVLRTQFLIVTCASLFVCCTRFIISLWCFLNLEFIVMIVLFLLETKLFLIVCSPCYFRHWSTSVDSIYFVSQNNVDLQYWLRLEHLTQLIIQRR